jgi:hypothetical protein
MDHFLKIKGYYIVTDNAHIHTPKEIDAMVTEKWY